MKIYVAILSEDFGQITSLQWAYKTKEEADAFANSWNKDREERDRKNAEEAGQTYEEWVGAYPDYAYVEQVELI